MTSVKALEASIIDHNVKLVVVDSIAALARSEFSRDKIVDRQQLLGMPLKHQITCMSTCPKNHWWLNEQAMTKAKMMLMADNFCLFALSHISVV